jgi:hypothetical protein
MNYNKVIYFLLGAAVLVAFPLIYLGLLRSGQTMLSPSQWRLFGGLALPVVVFAAILPIIIHRVRRARGLPPEHVSASDLRFTIALIAVLCPLTFFAVWIFPVFGSLVIMVVPFAFIIRAQLRRQPNNK